MKDFCKELARRFPFLSYGTHNDDHIVGITQNSDNHMINIYVYNFINDNNLKEQFIRLGDEWWWGSNRQIPINIFLRDKFKPFKPYLRSYSMKSFNFITGHNLSIQETYQKRIRRRQIKLVKK